MARSVGLSKRSNGKQSQTVKCVIIVSICNKETEHYTLTLVYLNVLHFI